MVKTLIRLPVQPSWIFTQTPFFWNVSNYLHQSITKPTKCARQRLRSAWASAQPDESSLCAQWVVKDSIRSVWYQSSLCAQWVVKDTKFLHADIEYSIRLGGCPGCSIFAGRKCHFFGFGVLELILFSIVLCLCMFYSRKPNNLQLWFFPTVKEHSIPRIERFYNTFQND